MEGNERLARCTGFDWDKGNLLKNWHRHRVTASECEQVFFNQPLILASDEKHSQRESRYFGLGRTEAGRLLFVVFTIRGQLIRIISARDMNRKERMVYNVS
ncbi:MAG: BrnT family toxin [Candidatus Omnitrophota bacterium]